MQILCECTTSTFSTQPSEYLNRSPILQFYSIKTPSYPFPCPILRHKSAESFAVYVQLNDLLLVELLPFALVVFGGLHELGGARLALGTRC